MRATPPALGRRPVVGAGSTAVTAAEVERDVEREVLTGIAAVAREHLGWEGDLRRETPLVEALALDSLRQLTLLAEIENRFRVCLEEEEEASFETVGDLVDAIRRKRGAGSPDPR